MGESKRRREKSSEYGATAFRSSLIQFLDEHIQSSPEQSNFSVATWNNTPTKTKIDQAVLIFQDWIAKNKPSKTFLLAIGTQENSRTVGIVDEENNFYDGKGEDTAIVLAAIFTLSKIS